MGTDPRGGRRVMPNHCENDLYLNVEYGEDKQPIADFIKYARTENFYDDGEATDLDFNKFVPQPDDLSKWEKGMGMPGWYNWRVENWGTKWNAYEIEVEGDNGWGEAVYHFDTAWAPPLPVVLAMSEKFPDIEFQLTYFESGMEFNGILRCKAGEILRQDEGKYFGNRGG